MEKILLITNMEASNTNFNDTIKALEAEIADKILWQGIQITSSEAYTDVWERRLQNASFVLITWMGTGLDCEFLEKASAYMHQHKIKHFINVMACKGDKLHYGVTQEEKDTIFLYFSCGGLVNYKNLVKFIVSHYTNINLPYEAPLKLPWYGIYMADKDIVYNSYDEYAEKEINPEWPVVGFVFYREDWLWKKTNYLEALMKVALQEQVNLMPVFSTTMPNPETGAPRLSETIHELFINKKGFPNIDLLINPFVFSLTRTGFVKLSDLKSLGVPVLQAVNVYKDYSWWEKDMVGLTPNEVSYAVAMPEFDGVIHSVPITTNEEAEDGTHYRKPIIERMHMLMRKARKWANLRHKANKDKKIAIVFHNYPPTNSNIGSASCIDSIESIRLFLEELKRNGYRVDNIPKTSQEFIESLTSHATNDRRFISEELILTADGKLYDKEYFKFYGMLPKTVQSKLKEDWLEAPGEVFHYDNFILVPGMLNGNIFITVQPPRGFGDDPGKIYHSPDCAPTHHYLGFYHWLRDIWQADVMVHVGTHGNLEWLPGKGNAMSNSCYPDICTGDMPNVYPYWITCVGEGIQAKRRSAACLISYLSAPMSVSGTYEELDSLEKLLEEYCHYRIDDEMQGQLEELRGMIRSKAEECNLENDVKEADCDDFDEYLGKLHVYITDLKNMQISTGLHILGIAPEAEELTEYMLALTKLSNGDTPSLLKTLAEMHGYDYYELLENSSQMLPNGQMTYGMFADKIREEAREIICVLQNDSFSVEAVVKIWQLDILQNIKEDFRNRIELVAKYICTDIAPSLLLTTQETTNMLEAFKGNYIEPGPSGAPTSGGADLLPTGRNFYSIDPRNLPTEAAWAIGKAMAEGVVEKFILEEGRYPESVGIILWATSNLRNHGQCLAEFLYLMGLKPVWQPGSKRVIDLEVIPLEELKRPRIDVTGRISGLFRDSMPGSVIGLDKAVQIVAALDEPLDMNFVRKHVLEEKEELEADGLTQEEAWREASLRIFGDPPGAHGAGIGAVLEAKNWENVNDLGEVYTRWGAHAYGAGRSGEYSPERFKKRMSKIDITLQNVDHRESSMLAGDDYNAYRGGMIAAVRAYKGSMPKNYVSDSSDRSKLQLRTLDEELKRWFRGEAMNPKYIQGMQKHGYKGAGDLATYVAVSYQWDATSEIMEDWMYEKYAEKYALNPEMQKWMRDVNPWALERISEVLLEAIQRGMWKAKDETKEALESLYLSIEGDLEEMGDKC